MDTTDLKRASGAALGAVKKASAVIRSKPALALLVSLGAGFVVGLISRRSAGERESR